MKRIITYGTFDLFHFGHLELLRRAKEMGDFLIVAVSTDDFNNEKGKKSAIPYKERAVIVEAIKYVDMVIPEYNWSQKKRDLIAFEAQMVMGDDWTGKFDEFDCIYLPRTPNISSTQIKNMLALKNGV